MNTADKPKFVESLNALFGAHGRTVWDGALSGYWKGLEKMSLMQFERCVEKSVEKLAHAERGVAKVPTVAELWDISRGIRSYERPQTIEDPWRGDDWDTGANLLLLAYIEQKKDRKLMDRYAPDSPYSDKAHHVVVGPITKARTAILVKWKDLWSRDMREDRLEGGKLDGKPLWFDYMTRAEAEIDQLIAKVEAA